MNGFSLPKRLLILAKDYNQAAHWAKENRMSPGSFVYISSYHNIQGNAGSEFVILEGYQTRPDADILVEELSKFGCKKKL